MNTLQSILFRIPWGSRGSAADRALVEAARRGDLPEVERLLERGARINFNMKGRMRKRSSDMHCLNGLKYRGVPQFGGTALMVAARRGHLGVVQSLIKRGAKLDLRENLFGYTALCFSARSYEITSELLRAGADPNVNAVVDTLDGRFPESPLNLATEHGSEGVKILLLQGGADPNVMGWQGRPLLVSLGVSPLSRPTASPKLVIEALIANGAEIGRAPSQW